MSNHFSKNVSSCSWLLDNKEYIKTTEILGFCEWKNFKFKTTITVLNCHYKKVTELSIDSLNLEQLKAMKLNCKVGSNYQNESFLKL